MTSYVEVQLSDLFVPTNGRPVFIKDYLDKRPGPHPVYSASLTKPFGSVDSFDYEGHYLTWVMNGYGGRMQEVTGKFSANRDRGVLVPKAGVQTPDLSYIRYAAEPELIANAVGRRVDGKRNEYTKIYPDTTGAITVELPVTKTGKFDYEKMERIGAKIRRIESAKAAVKAARLPLAEAAFAIEISTPSISLSLRDVEHFRLSIGKRVLESEHVAEGIPVYSANALVPFGHVADSNLDDFSSPSLLWGIDGNFDWNYIPAGEKFATTDHCGRLQIINSDLDPEFVYWYLKTTRGRYGFDRVYRASLANMRADVAVQVPLDPKTKRPSKHEQLRIAAMLKHQQAARASSLEAIDRVLIARLSIEL